MSTSFVFEQPKLKLCSWLSAGRRAIAHLSVLCNHKSAHHTWRYFVQPTAPCGIGDNDHIVSLKRDLGSVRTVGHILR